MTIASANTPRDLLIRLMDGYLSTQMLYVAARLGLADGLDNARARAQVSPPRASSSESA